MNVYIAGKITGLEKNDVEEKFKRMELYILANGLNPLNPVKLCECREDKTWNEYMAECLSIIVTKADAVVFLNDWEDSRGARCEMALAKELGIHICFERDYNVGLLRNHLVTACV